MVCAVSAHAGDEPPARDDRHRLRPGGAGPEVPPPHLVRRAALVAASSGLGDGRGPARSRARGAWRCPPSCSSIVPCSLCPTARLSAKWSRPIRSEVLAFPEPARPRRDGRPAGSRPVSFNVAKSVAFPDHDLTSATSCIRQSDRQGHRPAVMPSTGETAHVSHASFPSALVLLPEGGGRPLRERHRPSSPIS